MAKVKEITATTMWKPFVEIVKDASIIASGFTKDENNHLLLKMREGMFSESLITIKDPLIEPYYQWLCTDIDYMLTQLKNHNIKIKGTEILETEDKVIVSKDMEMKFDLEKIKIPEKAYSVYRKITQYLDKLLSPDTKWIPLHQNFIDLLIIKSPINIDMDFMDPTLDVGTVEMILSPTEFPLLKKAESLEFCLLDVDRENEKYYIGVKEEHEAYTMYSVIAIMMLDDD